jgi:hypothetical protein
MPVRRTPADNSSPSIGCRDVRILLPMSNATLRGPAPSNGSRFIPVRTSGLQSSLRGNHSQSLPAVLQPFLPSGFFGG